MDHLTDCNPPVYMQEHVPGKTPETECLWEFINFLCVFTKDLLTILGNATIQKIKMDNDGWIIFNFAYLNLTWIMSGKLK